MTDPEAPTRPARRSIVKGAAWAVPAVTLATAAPAVAASPGCIAVLGTSVCREINIAIFVTFYFSVDFRNNCSDEATVVATVTAQTNNGPESETGTLILTPGAAGRVTGSYTRFLGYNEYPTAMSVSFSVDGIDVPAQSLPVGGCTPAPAGAQTSAPREEQHRIPSDAELRTHLANNPHLLEQPEVQDLLRSHPEWDPRTSSRDSQAPAPTETSTDEATDAPPAEQTADTAEVTSSPNE